jgi:hypothetical protein
MITVFYCRRTQEAFVTGDSEQFYKEVFESGLRNAKDFETATSFDFIRIKPMGSSLDVTTLDFQGPLGAVLYLQQGEP